LTRSPEDDFESAATTLTISSVPSISTPVSYDEETGMVQTAGTIVRAIVEHPISTTITDNRVVGLSSTLVIAVGAFHEIIDCLELEWTHHATAGTTEGLAILSLGHFFHYGRETLRQLVEMQHHQQHTQQQQHQEATPPKRQQDES
jgi:hypothetical protein